LLGYLSKFDQEQEYISIIKDGAGVGRVEKRPPKSSIIGTMGYIKPFNSNINFIYATLLKMNLNKYTRVSTIPHIYFRDYGSYEFFVPTKNEQTKIGALFSKLDNLITLHQR
jgi:type I restriction enzyme S subunit